MERFWFDGDAQWAEIGTLSGGERRRLQLLMVLVAQPNVLLLDEPTNDLDLDTLRALEDFLDDWPGALVVVSHDRTFLDRTVEEVLALDGLGGAALVRGGYAGWIASRSNPASRSGSERATTARGVAERSAAGRAAPARSAPDVSGAVAPSAPVVRPRAGRSPSTLRRLLGQSERDLADAMARRDDLVGQLATVGADHERLAVLGAELAAAEVGVAAAEEHWLGLADEAEGAGLEM
jgi:ATP-binding cassette subfamily F protein uup